MRKALGEHIETAAPLKADPSLGSSELRVGAKSCRSPTSGRFHCGPHRDRLLAIKHSLCVTGEDKVARFDLIVAGEAGFHERLVARFAVLEVSETPTARCGVLFCVLDHELNVRWGAGYEGLGSCRVPLVAVIATT